MNFRIILAIHSVLFASLILGSLAVSVLQLVKPEMVPPGLVFVGAVIIAALVAGSFLLYRGCVFTIWENQFREREGKPQYSESCVRHYAYMWFGLNLPKRGSALVQAFLLLLPLVIALMRSIS